jgi:4-hydroxy-tetrahydrodipicolinate synthase
MAHGGHGCISVTANVVPRLCADMMNVALEGDFVCARALQDKLMPLHVALFLEPSPSGVKYAMSKLGPYCNELRMPLSPVSENARAAIDSALSIANS